ncbi:unnamed protein product [Somion occarium]|uniref:Uncharacterized protein n=1 Tax=Somion occarium TaxID=3059160 RepID=A0ABP1CNS9_9APHY
MRFSLVPLSLTGDDVVLNCHTRHGKEESTFLKHTPNTCVFATYPQSLETLSIIVLGSIQVEVTNKMGVTQWDVVAHVDQALDHALTFAELFEIYQTYRDADAAVISPHSLRLSQRYDCWTIYPNGPTILYRSGSIRPASTTELE